jgi:hypothetical protein
MDLTESLKVTSWYRIICVCRQAGRTVRRAVDGGPRYQRVAGGAGQRATRAVKNLRQFLWKVLKLVFRVLEGGRQLIFAAAVLVIALLLLLDAWRGREVAAAFTRVGGRSRIETAVEASRFWLEPPAVVVKTPAHESDEIRLGAARCAVRHDAPLLLTSLNQKKKRLVNETIAKWQERMGALRKIHVMEVSNRQHVIRCQDDGDPAYANELSTLGLPEVGQPDPELKIPK